MVGEAKNKQNNNSVELEASLAPAKAEVGAEAKADQKYPLYVVQTALLQVRTGWYRRLFSEKFQKSFIPFLSFHIYAQNVVPFKFSILKVLLCPSYCFLHTLFCRAEGLCQQAAIKLQLLLQLLLQPTPRGPIRVKQVN